MEDERFRILLTLVRVGLQIFLLWNCFDGAVFQHVNVGMKTDVQGAERRAILRPEEDAQFRAFVDPDGRVVVVL